MLTVPLVTDTDNYPTLREELEAAVKSLKKGKSPGIDNIPGDAVISAFNLRILCERYLQRQQDLYNVFIDFKKAFDRVWHKALGLL